MKYHFQLVSKTSVRIELIAEHQTEQALLNEFAQSNEKDENLLKLFSKGIATYQSGATLTNAKFMNFPKVALCSYQIGTKNIETSNSYTTEITL